MAEEEAEEVAEDRATARQWQLQLFRSRSEGLNLPVCDGGLLQDSRKLFRREVEAVDVPVAKPEVAKTAPGEEWIFGRNNVRGSVTGNSISCVSVQGAGVSLKLAR